MLIVGIAGGTGSGKTTLATKLAERLGNDKVAVIPHDSYYKERSDLTLAMRSQLNYDEPDAFETDLLISHLGSLATGKPVSMPTYDFSIHTRSPKTITVMPRPVIIVEGISAGNSCPSRCFRSEGLRRHSFGYTTRP